MKESLIIVRRLEMAESPFHGFWFVCRERPSCSRIMSLVDYLLTDLTWSSSMRDDHGIDGYAYFRTEGQAIAHKAKYISSLRTP